MGAQELNDYLVRRRGTIRATNRTLDGLSHSTINRFDLKGIFLSAVAMDFYRYHKRVIFCSALLIPPMIQKVPFFPGWNRAFR